MDNVTTSLQPLVSLVIRTKNEERWISSCLKSVFRQSYKNIEVIIVDNDSTDKTVNRAKDFKVKLVSIADFLPGKAINLGVHYSTGDYIVCLSAHCVPTNSHWLESLIKGLSDQDVAGIYGRQEPLSFSSDLDKRDLLTVFGLDKKIQIKDTFFHNANSAFRRDVWDKFPFDEEVTNIEDRVWGQKVITAGLKIIYEPEASVYHWHGIHQDLNPVRAKKIVRILETLPSLLPEKNNNTIEYSNVVAIIPLRGKSINIEGQSLLEFTIIAALNSKLVNQVIVSTDDEDTAVLARSLGAFVPFLRSKDYSEEHVTSFDVLRYSLSKIESTGFIPDLVVSLEETYPFRSANLIDNVIHRLVSEGLETVIASGSERRGIWLEERGTLELISEGFMPTSLKQNQAIIGYTGLAYVSHPELIRNGNYFGKRLGVLEVEDPFAGIQLRDAESVESAKQYLDLWWSQNYPLQRRT